MQPQNGRFLSNTVLWENFQGVEKMVLKHMSFQERQEENK